MPPRIDYERTYVLLPPDASSEWALAVISATWDQERYTVGGSADDAGIGELSVRNVIAVNPAKWNGDLKGFFDTYYPGVRLTYVEAGTPEELYQKLRSSTILLWQCFPKWKDIKIAGSSCPYTICQKGCWITCCAMAQRFYGIDLNATPETVNKILGPDGFKGCECNWSAMIRLQLRVLEQTNDLNKVNAHLATGNVCFAEVSPTDYTHFVLVTRGGKDGYWMLDPYKNFEGPLDEKYSGVDSWRLIARAEAHIEPPPPVITPGGFQTGLHDESGGEWLASNGVSGYCLVPVYVGTSPVKLDLGRFGSIVKVLANLRFSWSRPGGAGTMPPPELLPQYEAACIQTMMMNPGVFAFIYGNEMNNEREWPEAYKVEPDYFAKSYNRLWFNSPQATRLMPGAIDPFNPGWGDWRVAWRGVLEMLSGASGLTFHSYSHGFEYDKDQTFGDYPLRGVYYNLRVLESQQSVVPAKFQKLPQYVTETNHLTCRNGQLGWENDPKWLLDAYAYFKARGVQTACLYRFKKYPGDFWWLEDKPNILKALKALP